MPNKRFLLISLCLLLGLFVQLARISSVPTIQAANLGSDQSSDSQSGQVVTVPTIAGCPVFTPDSLWNRDVSRDQVDPNSDNYIANINSSNNKFLQPDFGSSIDKGINYVVVPGTQAKVPISFNIYGNQSDPGPYPIPPDAPVEGAGSNHTDKHVVVVDKDNCKLYELYKAQFVNPGWYAGAGAVFDLKSDKMRPEGWRSADGAGLPIFPGLVRYDEVKAGAINHALRVTVWRSQRNYLPPARAFTSAVTDLNRPPMGLRLRLKADYDISAFPPQAKVILQALKKYGMFVAETSDESWKLSGASSFGFHRADLEALKNVPGTAFEVVQSAPIGKAAIPPTMTLDPAQIPTATLTSTPIPTAQVGTLKVQYMIAQDAASPNQITPVFNIVSTDNDPIPLNTLKIRYFFTRDTRQPLAYHCAYATVGCDNVLATFEDVDPPVGGSDTYLEISFTPDAGFVLPRRQGGEIHGWINKKDWSNFNQEDDYSYDPTITSFTNYEKVALYRNETLVWGVLPSGAPIPTLPPTMTPMAPPPIVGALKVQYINSDTNVDNVQFSPGFNIVNVGSTPVGLNTLKIRYYFTRDTPKNIIFHCDYALIGCENITGTYLRLTPQVNSADSYIEVGFTDGAGVMPPGGQSGLIQTRMNKVDYSPLNQANDYSFDASKTELADWNKVTLYADGVLLWGTPPGPAAATSAPTRAVQASTAVAPTATLAR